MKVVAVVQAHMGSTRLPGKVARVIIDKPMLAHLICRLRFSKKIDEIVIATTDDQKDNVIVEIAEKYAAKWFRGSEEDVLDRMFQAAKLFDADIAVRVTSDNPLTDPCVIDSMIAAHTDANADYSWVDGLPIGIGAEGISISALAKANELAKDPYDREHVTPFIIRNKTMFHDLFLHAPPALTRPDYRLTVDYPEDFQLITEIFNRLYKPGKLFFLEEIVKILDAHPELLTINERTNCEKNEKRFGSE